MVLSRDGIWNGVACYNNNMPVKEGEETHTSFCGSFYGCLSNAWFFVHHHIPRLRFPLRESESKRFFLSLWGRGISSAYYSADDATITTTEAALPPTRIVATLKVAKHQTSYLFINA